MKADITTPTLQFLAGKELVSTDTIFSHLVEARIVSNTRIARRDTFETLLALRDIGALRKSSGVESGSKTLGFLWTLIPTENQ